MDFFGTDEFQQSFNKGYYFDRCIDLEFYDEDRTLISRIITPPKGFKPSIAVKGTFIEGSYAISSYVTIQNMAYNINVNKIKYIKCIVYYGGLRESTADEKIKNGHAFLFSVLYVDQEKEPPNRAVRFQCTLAAYDWSVGNVELKVEKGQVTPLLTSDGATKTQSGSGSKENHTVKLIDLLESLAKAYNKKAKDNDALAKKNEITYDDRGFASKKKKSLVTSDSITIKKIIYPKAVKNEKILVPKGVVYTMDGLLKTIGQNRISKEVKGLAGGEYKISITPGILHVDIIPPHNWETLLEKDGVSKEDVGEELIKRIYKDIVRKELEGSETEGEPKKGEFVPLNYVKSAYRNEIIINCSTIYDDRIYAGCYCLIAGNAIMGKHAARASRLTTVGKKVLFRATGSIEFEFSTTEDSYMNITGPVVDEDFKG